MFGLPSSTKKFDFFFNAEFDFELNNQLLSPKIKRDVTLMSPLFTPVFDSNVNILSNVKVDNTYYQYLKSHSLSFARLLPPKKLENINKAKLWGGSSNAITYLTNLGYTVDSPSPDICRKVNSREFSHTIQKECNWALHNSQIIYTYKELIRYTKNLVGNIVLKPLFGNSGAGFTFISLPNEINEQKITFPIIIEPWVERVDDFASLIEINKDGSYEIIGHHQNICNRSGAFYGTLISDSNPIISDYQQQILEMIDTVTTKIYNEGYWGIVSIDSFTYKDNSTTKLALAIDINCRYSMSFVAHSVYKKLGNKALFYRFIAKRRHKLPRDYNLLPNELNGKLLNNKSRAILLSPLRVEYENQSFELPRSAFAIVGNSIENVLSDDEQLRKLILKKS